METRKFAMRAVLTGVVACAVVGVVATQSVEPRVVKDMDAKTRPQDGQHAPMFVEHSALIGCAVTARSSAPKSGADAASGSASGSATVAGAEPERLGAVADLVIDTANGTLPFLVVQVKDGPRVALRWDEAEWSAGCDAVTLATTLDQLKGRPAIDPEHLDLLRTDVTGKVGVADAAAAEARGAAEATATPAAAPDALPRLWLATRLASLDAKAKDGDFGRMAKLIVEPRLGELRFVSVITGYASSSDRALHVVPWQIASLNKEPARRPVVQLDRDQETLAATPRLDAEDTSIMDPTFRTRIYGAVGIEPPRQTGTAHGTAGGTVSAPKRD